MEAELAALGQRLPTRWPEGLPRTEAHPRDAADRCLPQPLPRAQVGLVMRLAIDREALHCRRCSCVKNRLWPHRRRRDRRSMVERTGTRAQLRMHASNVLLSGATLLVSIVLGECGARMASKIAPAPRIYPAKDRTAKA